MNPEIMNTIVVWAGIGLVFLVLTMLAITDVLRKEFASTGVKAIWGIVSMIPFIGWLIYLVLGFRKGSIPAE